MVHFVYDDIGEIVHFRATVFSPTFRVGVGEVDDYIAKINSFKEIKDTAKRIL